MLLIGPDGFGHGRGCTRQGRKRTMAAPIRLEFFVGTRDLLAALLRHGLVSRAGRESIGVPGSDKPLVARTQRVPLRIRSDAERGVAPRVVGRHGKGTGENRRAEPCRARLLQISVHNCPREEVLPSFRDKVGLGPVCACVERKHSASPRPIEMERGQSGEGRAMNGFFRMGAPALALAMSGCSSYGPPDESARSRRLRASRS